MTRKTGRRFDLPATLRAVRKAMTSGGRPAAFLLLLLAILWRIVDPGFFLEIGRAKVFDFYQQLKPREAMTPSPVVVIDIDEASLAELGQWPWPRTYLAQMVQNLKEAGAVAIGFDVVFAEPDRTSPGVAVEAMVGVDPEMRAKLKTLPSNDTVFAQVIKDSGIVVLGQSGVNASPDARPLPEGLFAGNIDAALRHALHYPAMLRNIEELEQASAGRGVFSVAEEQDGIVRRVPAIVAVDKTLHPALSIELLHVAMSEQTLGVRARDDSGIEFINIRPNRMQTDGKGRIYVYANKWTGENYIPAKDILYQTVDPARLAGKIVLIGTSATGLHDIRATAIDKKLPGVDVHAQIIETVLSGQQLTVPANAQGFEASAMLTVALLMIILVPMIGARWTLIVFLTASGTLIGGSWWYFAHERTLYDPVFPALVALLLFILLTYWGYASEEAQRRQVRTAFSRYLSPALVEKVAHDPSRLVLGGEMRDMTLLFCDIRGFTTISELFDAQGLTKLINRFLTPMTNVILDRYGTIDKYMGDCIMAFWNAPLDDADHARHACESALVMMERLQPLNDELEAEAKVEQRRHVPIKIGIGLNSGPVCVGNMGSDQRFDYSVLGDTVNLASRLEGQSKPYGVYIVIGDETRKRATDYAALELDLIKVKGKTEAVRIWTLLGRPDMDATPWFKALEEAHKAMLAAYRGQRWDEARALLATLDTLRNGLHLEGFYALMEERIGEYLKAPPGEAWDGVFTATSK
ncbi:MAG: adenylate/guanylate cyclase domain-containing protein [Magnetospirillum sp.]|nr:adenylate/guanylate cyclase domain-containing protein [Magnetospirillum sp.]